MDLIAADLSELAELIRTKKVSPVEAMRWNLERIQRLNPRLNAFISLAADDALNAARAAETEIMRGEYRGPLHGVALAIKDIIDVRGTRTTCGSKIMGDSISKEDATAVARLRAAGGIILGKLHLHEFAWGATSENPHFGPARNPWNPQRIPGGSSGGSAIAVAASMAMGTLGTDTGGSVRIPAALCGVTGLKPTYGRVSRHGAFTLCDSLDTIGPLARSARDAALILQAIAGRDPNDPSSVAEPVPNYAGTLLPDLAGVKLGLLGGFFRDQVQAEVLAAVDAAAGELRRLGAETHDLTLPLADYVPAASLPMMLAESFEVHSRFIPDRLDDYGRDVRMRLLLGATVGATDYLRVQRFRTLLLRQMLEALQECDALLAPTTPLIAPPIGKVTTTIDGREVAVAGAISRLTRPFNLTGLPAVSTPAGFAQGLPIGLQIIGAPFAEGTVLRIAHAFQSATDWHKERPPLPE